MASLKCYILNTCLLLSLTIFCSMASYSSSEAVKGAYWTSWTASNFAASDIDTTLFTHVYYAFLSPNNVTFKFDIDDSIALALVNFTSTLHYTKNPPVKKLFSIGGASEVARVLLASMASCPSSRKNFILSSIEVARKFGFDGMDLDWEFPKSPKEMDDLGLLLDEWRAEVQNEAIATCRPQLLLTAAVYYSVEFTDVYRKFPVYSINRNLDWINAMCYDYHGSWNTTQTGAPAALFDPKSNLSTSYGLVSWIKAGLHSSKLIMGLPLYGRTWQLKDPMVNGVGAPAVDVGPSRDGPGTMSYADVEEFNKQNGATVVYDVDTLAPYSVVGTSWIGYDDDRSIALKIGYAQVLGLRGYFFWAVNGDQGWKISRTASNLWIFQN